MSNVNSRATNRSTPVTLHSEEHRTWRRVLNDCTTLPPFYPSHGKALSFVQKLFFPLPRSFPHQPGFPLLFPRLDGVETEGILDRSSSPNLISLVFDRFPGWFSRWTKQFYSKSWFDTWDRNKRRSYCKEFILFNDLTLNIFEIESFDIFFLLHILFYVVNFLKKFLDFSIRIELE